MGRRTCARCAGRATGGRGRGGTRGRGRGKGEALLRGEAPRAVAPSSETTLIGPWYSADWSGGRTAYGRQAALRRAPGGLHGAGLGGGAEGQDGADGGGVGGPHPQGGAGG